MAPPSNNNGKAKSPSKAIIAGGISGGLEIMITYPTEFVKTQLQLSNATSKVKFNGVGDVVRHTFKQTGVLGFYRGLSPLLFFSIPKSAIRFGANEYFKSLIQGGSNLPLTRLETILCGLGAGLCEAVGAVTPMETIKVKFIHDQAISEKPRFKGLVHGVSTIAKESGIKGLYKGLFPTMLKQSTNQAIRFFVYDEVSKFFKGEDRSRGLNVPESLAAGTIAGAASVFGNTPIDVVKTRMQGLESHKYKSSWECTKTIWKNEGFRAFYKGTTPRLGRVCLDVALVFTFYEQITKALDLLWKD